MTRGGVKEGAPVVVRRLADADAAALYAYLALTEERSVFLVGNAREHGLEDRGGALHGAYFGAFEGQGERLAGVLAYFRGPDSVTPACGAFAEELMAALGVALGRHVPHVMVGTSDRVDAALAHAPARWQIAKRQREVLMVLRWDGYRAPTATTGVVALGPERAEEAAELIGVLHRDAGLPTGPTQWAESAQRLTREGRIFARVDPRTSRAVAMSTLAAATGRFAHVGATVCRPEARRRGHATACVAAVIDVARARGEASTGATLFTGDDNARAIALYEKLGFSRAHAWEMCFFARPA